MTYKVAFLQLADPYAWMLRGLIDIGWEDISLSPESYPQVKGRGIDYSRLIHPMSRFGLRLVTLALDENNEWYRKAGSYEFEARLVNDPRLSYSILLRSDEMAFSKLKAHLRRIGLRTFTHSFSLSKTPATSSHRRNAGPTSRLLDMSHIKGRRFS